MARQLASINLKFNLDGSISLAHIQERLVVEDGEGGHLSRDLPLRDINPGDADTLKKVFGDLAGQQQVALVEKDTIIAEKEAKVAELEAKVVEAEAKVAIEPEK